ncbi:MAG: hypothetical protein JW810_04370 [Sedimentisphaerales bacterium]|nr:hypothetical protein [Sedimentisphaerales bacterium]
MDIGFDSLRMLQRQDCQGRVQIRAAAQERFCPAARRAAGTGFLRHHNSRHIIDRLLGAHRFKGNQVVTCLKADQLCQDQITVPVEATHDQRQALARCKLGWSDGQGCIWFYPAGQIVSGPRPQRRYWIFAASEETLLRQRLDLADMGLDCIGMETPVGILWGARRIAGQPEVRDQLQLLVDIGRRFATVALIHRDTLVWAKSCERTENRLCPPIDEQKIYTPDATESHSRRRFDHREPASIAVADPPPDPCRPDRAWPVAFRHPLAKLAECIYEGLEVAQTTIGDCPLSLFCLGGGAIRDDQRQWLEARLGRRLQRRGSLTEQIRQADSSRHLEREPYSEWITAWMLSGSSVRQRRLSVPA